MSPIVPHISSECLEMINSKKCTWPEYDLSMFEEDKINIVIQVNGKKRGLISIEKDMTENEITNYIENKKLIERYISNGKLVKKIYIKNRLINYIVK